MPRDIIPKEDPILAKLRFGRDRIARGWCKGHLRRVSGEYCAVGAVIYSKEGVYDSLACSDVCDLLRAEVPGINQDLGNDGYSWTAIVSFNNARRTTQGDVLGMFDRAIVKRKEFIDA